MINLYAGKRDIFAVVKGLFTPAPGIFHPRLGCAPSLPMIGSIITGDVRHPGQRWRTSQAALRQVLPHIFLPAVPDCHSADMTKFAAKMKTQ